MEWILYILIQHGDASIAINHVDGFKTHQDCEKVRERFSHLNNYTEAYTFCEERKD